jgi:hypothetical protein
MKIRLGTTLLAALLLCLFLAPSASAKWHQDDEWGFKIEVPDNWKERKFMQETDRVNAFVSPDQMVAVRVRAFKTRPGTNAEQVAGLFEKGVIKGCERIDYKPLTVNGLAGQFAAYKWTFNNTPVGVVTFYAVRGEIGYVVWMMTPSDKFQARHREGTDVMDTFTLVASGGSGLGGSLETGVRVTSIATGDQMAGDFELASVKTRFSPDTPYFHMVFEYDGEASAAPFLIKWVYVPENYLIDEVSLDMPEGSGGVGHSNLSKPDKGWPAGEYSVQIWRNNQKVKEARFSVSGQ